MNIGNKLKELRIQKGLTQEDLADRAELSKGFISQLERDLTSPSIATLVDILQVLGTDLNEFFSEKTEEQIVFSAQDYFEKVAGVEVRRKIRLRIYDPDGDFAMLEMKQKQGANQLKRSLRLSRVDAVCLTKGDYSPLLRYEDPFAAECYGLMHSRCYRPKTIVQYNRKAFIAKENKIRVTFDSHLVSTESCFELFSPRLVMNPVLDQSAVILEVKYNGFLLDYIRRMINGVDRSELSVSKYVLARQAGYQTRV